MSTVLAKWYSLTINGSQVNDEVKRRITDITLEVKEKGSATLSFTMIDNNLEYLTKEYLQKDAKVSFKCAWYDSRTEYYSFVGYISVVDVDYGSTVKLKITCMDESYPMSKEDRTRTWENVKVSEVAKEIFQSYGLTAHIDDTEYTEDSISQSNQNDANFMNSLTEKVTHKVFIWYVDGKDGYFVERKMPSKGGKELGFKTGNNQILSFSPRLKKGKLKIKKTSSDVDASTGATTASTTESSISASSGSSTVTTGKKYENGKWVSVTVK